MGKAKETERLRIEKVLNVRLVLIVVWSLLLAPAGKAATNFTHGSDTARKYGVHEIILTGDGSVPNPFDTPCEVTFTSPTGVSVTVNAFYDCRDTWRARCYVNETGRWSWRSSSARDHGLDGESGSFTAVGSGLRGKIIKDPDNSNALATDDGRWFLCVGDTPYSLFQEEKAKWKEYVRDDQDQGITFVRATMLGAQDDWDPLFKDGDHDRLNVHKFQINDDRLIWMLDHYPDMYVEFILLPGCNTGWSNDETFWYGLTASQHRRILKYIVARYAAFPEIVWQIVNDYNFSPSHPHNVALANEAGDYLMKNDPWGHLTTAGGIRGDDFYFPDKEWATFFHLETLDALPADQVKDYTDFPVHVFCGEDRYETYRQPDHPAVFFRRLIWSWTLSGGSACYGGDWDDIVPYSESSLHGLDNMIYVKDFFVKNEIDLSGYLPDDNCVTSNARGAGRPKVMRTQDSTSYVIYHPNASVNGQGADISPATPYLSIDDLPAADYELVWMRADNGEIQKTDFSHDGGNKLLVSPWEGTDVVLYLHADPAKGVRSPSGGKL